MLQTSAKKIGVLIIGTAVMLMAGFFVLPMPTQAVSNSAKIEQLQRPKKVKNVRVQARYKKKIRIRWKAKKNVNWYQIEVRQSGEVVKRVRVKKSPKKGKRFIQHTIKKLDPGTRYVIRVRAKRKGAKPKSYSKFSKRLRVWTKGKRPAPEQDGNDEEEGGEESPNEEEEEQIEESPEEGGEEEEAEEPVEEESVEEESDPILFGFWGLNDFIDTDGLEQVQTDFNSTVFQVASSGPGYTVNTLLPLVKESGMKVTLRMTPGPDYNSDFDLEGWKDHIDTWAESGVQAYIDDGTLVGHMLLDDILNFSYISGSTDPTGDELDEMARYSEEAFPGLMTFVRNQATTTPVPTGGEFTYLDAVVNQYRYQEGDVETYVATESETADSLNVRSIYGMNIVDGGDGTSSIEGIRTEKYAMTASEITEYGEVLLAAADYPLFLMWEFDGEALWQDGTTIGSDYFSQSSLKAALAGLGSIAAGE